MELCTDEESGKSDELEDPLACLMVWDGVQGVEEVKVHHCYRMMNSDLGHFDKLSYLAKPVNQEFPVL
jgi:hypothetical protein